MKVVVQISRLCSRSTSVIWLIWEMNLGHGIYNHIFCWLHHEHTLYYCPVSVINCISSHFWEKLPFFYFYLFIYLYSLVLLGVVLGILVRPDKSWNFFPCPVNCSSIGIFSQKSSTVNWYRIVAFIWLIGSSIVSSFLQSLFILISQNTNEKKRKLPYPF